MLKRLILIHVQVKDHLPLAVFIFHDLLVPLLLRCGGRVFPTAVGAFTTWQYSTCLTEITFESVLVNPCSHL